ncbi:MAG: calcium-binding protein, partial [Gallionella sp.]|nr:calcium-binding protein [Gallionella sp.]
AAGTGTSFNMTADTTYAAGALQVRQTDVAGNISLVGQNAAQWVEDSTPPATTFTGSYFSVTAGVGTLLLTGTNMNNLGANSAVVTSQLALGNLVWDINADNAGTANVAFNALGGTVVATVLNNYTLQLTLDNAATTTLTGTPGYGITGGVDALDLTAGLVSDAAGNLGTLDSAANLTIQGAFNNPVVSLVYSYTLGDTFVVEEAYGNITALPGAVDFTVNVDTLTFLNVSASAVTVGGSALAGGAGPNTVGVGGNIITLTGFTAALDATEVIFADGSVLKTNNTGTAATLTGSNLLAAGDQLIAGSGGDALFGYAGNDVLTGGAGADAIYGGSGNDTIWGQGGNDYLSGSVGADIFKYTGADDGQDVITGFGVGVFGGANVDKLEFAHLTNAEAQALTTIVSGTDTLIIDGADTIRLLGVTAPLDVSQLVGLAP